MKLFEKSNEIYNAIKKYVDNYSNYNVAVKKSVIENVYPLIVYEMRSSNIDIKTQDRYSLDKVYNMNFEISIFAINDKNINSNVICEELSQIVMNVFECVFGMSEGGLDAIIQNINTSNATKYVLHYSCKYNPRQNIIY